MIKNNNLINNSLIFDKMTQYVLYYILYYICTTWLFTEFCDTLHKQLE